MSKNTVSIAFFHRSVLQTFPQFPSATDETVAALIRAWYLRSCKVEVDPQDFDTASSISPNTLCFSVAAVIKGPSRPATKPIAVACTLAAMGLMSAEQAAKCEVEARAAGHVFKGAGKPFVHFVLFKPWDLHTFLRWAVPNNCGAQDLLCLTYKESDSVQLPYQPLACVHTEVCQSEGDETLVERVTTSHLTTCLRHTARAPTSPRSRLRALGQMMEDGNMQQTVAFFQNPEQVSAVDRRGIPIETWAVFHPCFSSATFDSSNSIVLDTKHLSNSLPKLLRPLVKTLVSGSPTVEKEWRLIQVQVAKLTAFMKEKLEAVQRSLPEHGWSSKAFGGYQQWNEIELAHAFSFFPAPEKTVPAALPQQPAINFAVATVPSHCVRFCKAKSAATVLHIRPNQELKDFYAYFRAVRAAVPDAVAAVWEKHHRVNEIGTLTISIGSFSEIQLFFELMSREVGCDCAFLASLVPVVTNAAKFDEAAEGITC